MQSITPIPGVTSFVEGIINLRERVLPVLDLRKRLGLAVADHTEESRIVVVDSSSGEVGVIVDAVTEVLRIPTSSIDPNSSMVMHSDSDYLRGIAKLPDRLIILIDLNKLLSSSVNGEAVSRLVKGDISEAKKIAVG
jgi:purine-binding chemotaxis protein CheW